MGDFSTLRHVYTYMVYSRNDNTMRISGEMLPADSLHITLHGNGQWNPLPCLFDKTVALREALADYYDHATPGDLIKSHTRFATFSADRKWVGDLSALTPGEGYFIRRMGEGDVTVRFFNQSAGAAAPAKMALPASSETNMTMIAKLTNDPINDQMVNDQMVNVYIGDVLVGVAKPISLSSGEGRGEDLYFLTIQSDKSGTLRFELEDGTVLRAIIPSLSSKAASPLPYVPDAHYGTPEEPIILLPSTTQQDGAYKFLRNELLFIECNGKIYNAQGALVK